MIDMGLRLARLALYGCCVATLAMLVWLVAMVMAGAR